MADVTGPGSYVLILHLGSDAELTVGRLGVLRLPAGYYAYVGSALAGLRARVARHLRRNKRHHWHIDYVLDVAEIVEVWVHRGTERVECSWAALLGELMTPSAPGLGSSDCRCPTHLFYSPDPPSLASFGARQPECSVQCLINPNDLT